MLKSPFFQLIFILLLSLIIRLLLISYHLHDPHFNIQQDNYANYAYALSQGKLNTSYFPEYDKRLFPGYPILILLISFFLKSEILSSVIISLVASLMSIYLFWVITKNIVSTVVFAFFPPIWVVQATKATTEPIMVFLLLLAIIFYLRKKLFLSGALIGFAFDIRIIAVCLLIALLYHSYVNKAYKAIFFILLGFMPFASLLFIYNFFIFDKSILYQFTSYPSIGRATFGTLQVIQDIFRTIDWKQYRILISGVSYILLNIIAVISLYRKRNASILCRITFYWMALSLVFIFSISPTPLLEEFSRFSVPFVPALILGILSLKKST